MSRALIRGPDDASRGSDSPRSRTFTWVPPMSTARMRGGRCAMAVLYVTLRPMSATPSRTGTLRRLLRAVALLRPPDQKCAQRRLLRLSQHRLEGHHAVGGEGTILHDRFPERAV